MSLKRGIVDFSSASPTIDLLAPVAIDATAAADVLLGQFRAALDPLIPRVLGQSAGAPARIGVAFPGPMDYERGISHIRGQRKFDSLYDVDLRAWTATAWAAVSLDIRFVNDAEAAALGESIGGASLGFDRSLMVTLGTGFGAAAVVNGRPAPIVAGVEVGHLFAHQVDGLGRADDVLSAVGLATLLDVGVDAVADAAAEARRGDVELQRRFAEFGQRLGQFLDVVAPKMNSEVIVIGGGAANSFDLFGPMLAVESGVAVRCAQLGSSAALLGAASHWLSSSL
jgi:glucokinase